MQRAILPALSLSICVFGVSPSASRAQPLDAGVPFDAATYGIVPPPPPPPDALADGGATQAAPVPLGGEAPVEVGAETPVDVGSRTLGGGAEGAIDVTVREKPKEAQRLRRSAEAVSVVDLQKAQQRSSDLGEVLARTQGVTLRRSGGLGSSFRFFLNGLSDDQIRFFLDSIPLDLAGFPQGIANMPVNLLDRVEVFRAVVPLRFGVDALGGGINLVTPERFDTGGDVSYQVGSFHTHRLTAQSRYHHQDSGFVAKAAGYLDDTDNDYEVDVEVADRMGQLKKARVKRPHDRYRAWGVSLETGVIERKWAERLLVRGYITKYDNELQNNLTMEIPYGEVTYGGLVGGTSLRYAQPLSKFFHLDLTGVYARRVVDFVDKSTGVYDWYGKRVNVRRVPGEIDGDATDQTNWQDTGYARAVLTWKPSPQHEVRAASTAQFSSRTGHERIRADPTTRDPLTAERKLMTVVSGLEYQANAVPFAQGGRGAAMDFNFGLQDRAVQDADPFTGYRLQNILFVKTYNYRVDAEDPRPGGVFRRMDNKTNGIGAGNSLRYTFTKHFFAKGSYEYAIRLPRADEVFGDNVLIDPNLELDPERSHNVNLGPQIDLKRSKIGSLLVDLNGFLRDTDKQIVLLGNEQRYTFQNVYRARTLGVESTVAWASPGRWVNLDGSVTYQDQRNSSSKGTFGDYKGDRIPNRPYFMASWGSSLRFAKLVHDGDALEPFYTGRYVHSFYRGWESLGLKASKDVIPTQVLHGLGLTYTLKADLGSFSATAECTNLTSARIFDNFGAQKPNRGYWLKLTAQI